MSLLQGKYSIGPFAPGRTFFARRFPLRKAGIPPLGRLPNGFLPTMEGAIWMPDSKQVALPAIPCPGALFFVRDAGKTSRQPIRILFPARRAEPDPGRT